MRRLLAAIGKLLLATGVLVLLFTAYQLWGTGLAEIHSQATLRTKLAGELPRSAQSEARRLASGATGGGATTTTLGSAGDGATPGIDGATAGAGGASSGPPHPAPNEPTPQSGQPVGTIDIPSIGLTQVVVQGVATSDLEMGPGHYPGTPLPGEAGNVAIAGHRTTFAHPFYNLNAVAPGDPIILTTPQGVFVYDTQRLMVVAPTDVSVVAPTTSAILTLTTCNPRYSAATRLVLRASLERSVLLPAAGSGAGSGRGTARGTTTPGSAEASRGAPVVSVATALAGRVGSGWVGALAWGLGVLAASLAVFLLARRSRRRWAWYLPGTVVVLTILFFFFGAVTPLLPPSF